MKIEGYVISSPVKYSSRKWYHHCETFGKTPQEAWILWLGIQPDNYGRRTTVDDWFRQQQHWINLGYCPKKATMEIEE